MEMNLFYDEVTAKSFKLALKKLAKCLEIEGVVTVISVETIYNGLNSKTIRVWWRHGE